VSGHHRNVVHVTRADASLARGSLPAGSRAITVGLILAVTIVALEAIAVATAMPTVVRSLHGLAYYAWPFSAFLLGGILGMVVAGEVTDTRGARLPMIVALVGFGLGLLIAGTATTMVQLVIGRFVQGVAGGGLVVVVYAVTGETYPPAQQPRIIGLFSAAWVLPSLLGPVFAGAVAEHVGWRWVFLGLLPPTVLGAALILSGLNRIHAHARPCGASERRRSRWPFAVLAGLAVAGLQQAGQSRDALGLVIGVLSVAALVPAVRALLPRGTVTLRRGLPTVVAMRGLAAGAFFAVDALVPLTLSAVHGYSPTSSGLPLTFGALGWSGAAWLTGRWPELSRPRLARYGMVGVAVAAAGMAVVAFPQVSPLWAFAVWLVGGAGMGLVISSVGVLVLDYSTDADRGRNTSAVQIGAGGLMVGAAEHGSLGLPAAITAVDASMVVVALIGVAAAGRLSWRRTTSAR
jgi:MFS family permease